jgi:cobalt-zinc-cadmium efflux system protein
MHDPAHHHHIGSPKTKNRLFLAAGLILVFSAIEALGGWLSNSLTLLSDSGHMLADSLTLVLAAFAAWVASKPSSEKHTYGFGRAEVIAAWLSSLLLIVITVGIFIEALYRLEHPRNITSQTVIIIACFGFLTNLALAFILGRGEKTLNTRAALLHILSDLLGSIIALISGVIIYFTHWSDVDPILSLAICALILFSTVNLLRESLVVLMEGVPRHLSIKQVAAAINKAPGVISVHDLHIWTLTGGTTLLTAHVVLEDICAWPEIVQQLRVMLLEKFAINHATLQPETKNLDLNCKCCNSL